MPSHRGNHRIHERCIKVPKEMYFIIFFYFSMWGKSKNDKKHIKQRDGIYAMSGRYA